MNLKEIEATITKILEEEAACLLGGIGREYHGFAEKITFRLIEHASTGNEKGLDLTLARLHLLDERIRIKANDMFWSALRSVTRVLFRFLAGSIIPEIKEK